MATSAGSQHKHRQLFAALERDIRDGRWGPGARLPSEAALVREHRTSRITVGRAMRDLALAGLVERRAGSGSFVRAAAPPAPGHTFGLIIPDLGETEIFEPICQGMMASPLAREHALLWGGTAAAGAGKEERALALCRQWVERRVSGVFFAPLELTPSRHEVNRRIVRALDEARIPVVMLDRDAVPYPGRGRHDLVGIDNRRAGLVVTEHLLRLGARRVAFVGLPGAASTVDLREAGWREAHHALGLTAGGELSRRIDPTDAAAVRELLASARPDAVACANDWTAARLMRSLLALGVAVPGEVRLAGIDDVEYAALLPVPLTTLRQPTRAIGAAALATMLERVAGAGLPPRDILLQGELVVRASCGAPAAAGEEGASSGDRRTA